MLNVRYLGNFRFKNFDCDNLTLKYLTLKLCYPKFFNLIFLEPNFKTLLLRLRSGLVLGLCLELGLRLNLRLGIELGSGSQ